MRLRGLTLSQLIRKKAKASKTFAQGHQDYVERVMLRKAGEKTWAYPLDSRALTGLRWVFTGRFHSSRGAAVDGKTLYVWQAAITAARHGHHAFVMNLEMAFSRIQERSACATSGFLTRTGGASISRFPLTRREADGRSQSALRASHLRSQPEGGQDC